MLALLAGLAGGYGGRRLALLQAREELGELTDLVEQLGRRVARRDGQEGAARRRSKAEALDEVSDSVVQAALARHRAGGEDPGAFGLEQARASAVRLFNTKND